MKRVRKLSHHKEQLEGLGNHLFITIEWPVNPLFINFHFGD